MKRRVLSLVIILTLCLNLSPVWVYAAGDSGTSPGLSLELERDVTYDGIPRVVALDNYTINTHGFTLYGTADCVVQVLENAGLTLIGIVESTYSDEYYGLAGVQVMSGGSLTVSDAGTRVTGRTYGLEIQSGATVTLSAGTYSGRSRAIYTENGDLSALLAPGCAYFDETGSPLTPADAKTAKTLIVDRCRDHSKTYTHASGATEHSWTCEYCGASGTETCTFEFDEDGDGTSVCGNRLTIDVDEDSLNDLIYNGTGQTANVGIKVTLTDTDGLQTVLAENTDYKVTYASRTDVGEVTVTVTGLKFIGTFTKIYNVSQDRPALSWSSTGPVALDYDGSPVEASELPTVQINILSNADNLQEFLQYSYKKATASDYTDGLPTNAGTYDVIVSLPEMQNFQAAVSDPITLTINKINPIATSPAAKTLTFDGTAQALVTAGTLKPVAVRDGVEILFAEQAGGPYSTAIPTGINAGSYNVWYQTEAADNYNAVSPQQVSVTIQRKQISPRIELSESSYLYDGTKKEPKITVKDGTTVLDDGQYTVTWEDANSQTVTELVKAGTYQATIEGRSDGNYDFSVTAEVEIVEAVQGALTITGQPAHVYYGDTITTLNTTGGTGNGMVTWSVTSSGSKSTIDQATGVLTVKDTGSITVKAERAVSNYETVEATWTFTVEPKPVVADVTIASKDYDGTTTVASAAITAEVKPGDLVDPSDSISISGLTGVYDNPNAGTNKTVTLGSSVSLSGDTDKYTVSYPGTAKADITPRGVGVTVELSGNDLQKDANGYYYAYDGNEKTPDVTVTADDDDATLAASDYTVSYSNNKNAGTASVKVQSALGGNYTFDAVDVDFEIRSTDSILTQTPQAKDLTYTGDPQDLVTVGTASGGKVVYSLSATGPFEEKIPQGINADTYTVYYMVDSDNNHDDTNPSYVYVTIKQKEVISPIITVAPGPYTYTGNEHKPLVTVEDNSKTIPDSEYTLTYRDNINAGTATVIVSDRNGGNYIVNGEAAFVIGKGTAAVAKNPTGNTVSYNGTAQELVTAGSASNGTMVYSLNQNGDYFPVIPTGTAVGSYTVYFKAQGDSNYEDSTTGSVTAEITKNNVTSPTIQVTPESVSYTGKKQTPVITVYDDNGYVIDGSEYTVTYATSGGNGDLTSAGIYTVTIKNTASSNYLIDDNSKTFEILKAGQEALTITGQREHVYYGDTIQLDTTGGNGTIAWSVSDSTIAKISTGGLLTIEGVGSVTVTATSTAADYTDKFAAWPIYVERKPVTAIVTAAAKTYDGSDSADVTATLQSSDLVGTDDIKFDLDGRFEDCNVGTNKKVIVDSTNPSFNGTGDYTNYNITFPSTTTASIFKANIDNTKVTAPKPATGLSYTGDPLTLVTLGSSPEGTLEYSLNNITYTAAPPTGTNAGSYDVWYRVKGDSNHNDTTGTQLGTVVIDPQAVTSPIIEFTPSSVSYDGAVHKPAVTVKDSKGREIPADEYTVNYGTSGWITAGPHTVTISDASDGNYNISSASEDFTILPADQIPLTIVNFPDKVQYGDTFQLVASGGSGTGGVTWKSSDTNIATIDTNGVVKILKSGGPVTITATRAADGNYGAVEDAKTFNVEKKPVTPIVTARDKVYDINDTATLDISWQPGALLAADSANLNQILSQNLTGTFDNPNVGENKTVRITLKSTLPESDYAITLPTTTTASILPKAAEVTTVSAPQLTYTGNPLDLISGVTATNGTVVYSRNGVDYDRVVPSETNAGTYIFWYKALADENYKDSRVVEMTVTIAPKPVAPTIQLSQSTYDYDGTEKKPDVVVLDGTIEIPASEYTVSYSDNTQAGNATVKVSNANGGNYNITETTENFTINAATAVLNSPPKANNLTYDGFAHALVTPGTATKGHLVYAEEETGTYTVSIPEKTDAGSYQVWYKVKGENGAGDTTPQSISVTIQPKLVRPTILLNNSLALSTPYTGSEIKPTVTVVMEGRRLDSSAYEVEYNQNTNPGSATVIVQNDGGNYQFFEIVTFEITKSQAAFSLEPAPNTLVYTGKSQDLVTAGTSTQGTVLYSTNYISFSPEIPKGIDADSYTVYAKVSGGSNYEDSDIKMYSVTIGKNEPQQATVSLNPSSFSYTGKPHEPAVIVYDDYNNLISASEYTVKYDNNVNVTTSDKPATVTVTGNGNNYEFTATENFTILGADQVPLNITGPDTAYYGDPILLSTTGGSVTGSVTWSSSNSAIADIDANGVVTTKKAGLVTITANIPSSGGYNAVSDTHKLLVLPKPVEAVVTAADRQYDSTTDVTLTVTISASDLVAGDTINTGNGDDITAKGEFMDGNVGTNKTVKINSVSIPTGIGEKYDVSYPSQTTASITPAPATVTGVKAQNGLTYNGSEQPLVDNTDADVTGGSLAYSLDGDKYTYSVPTAANAGSYIVWYKVIASDNYKDSVPSSVNVTIGPNTDTPSVQCIPSVFQYDNTEKTPTVEVRDPAGRLIPESEYTVSFSGTPITADTYTVTVTDRSGGNYEFASATGTFQIVKASQTPLSITGGPATVYYGDKFTLDAIGGSGSGTVQWSISSGGPATISTSGVVTVTGTGAFTVEAYRAGGTTDFEDSNKDQKTFYAYPKPVTPVVRAEDKDYNATTNATLHASWNPGDMVGADSITLTVNGEFQTSSVGTNKQVDITFTSATGDTTKYAITWPEYTTASIYRVDAKVNLKPAAISSLTYDGNAQELVTAGTTLRNIGTIEYSLKQDGPYSTDIPKAINAGTHTVWYKIPDSVNYQGTTAEPVEVKIEQAVPAISAPAVSALTTGQPLSASRLTSGSASLNGKSVAGSFAWVNDSIVPTDGDMCDVIFTPDDTTNYKTVTVQVRVTVTGGSSAPGTNDSTNNNNNNSNSNSNSSSTNSTSSPANSAPASASVQTTVQNGTASSVLSEAAGSRLVQAAAANQSESIVIEPEITGAVTRTEVSIPASTVSQISRETDAALVVSSPIADVTISNTALDALSLAGGGVSVTAEQVEQSVVLTLTSGGEPVESVPGGVTLTVPVEDAVPGTVAVLVHDDGTRETLRKSVVSDGQLSIPLDGSATVEIVDNSKDFADVPDTSWAAEAVAFASAHELFSGTSETTFSPDLAMSRAMLAAVLYSLEGSPELALADEFSDVTSEAWYAEGVAWAVENGIASGYGDGQFGPDDSITREQFAVILWRYAGSPEASSQTLDFADADQVDSYALEALCWAVENGIMSGYGDGQLAPGGTATRAQAAQMLKNFMEHT